MPSSKFSMKPKMQSAPSVCKAPPPLLPPGPPPPLIQIQLRAFLTYETWAPLPPSKRTANFTLKRQSTPYYWGGDCDDPDPTKRIGCWIWHPFPTSAYILEARLYTGPASYYFELWTVTAAFLKRPIDTGLLHKTYPPKTQTVLTRVTEIPP